MLVFSRAGILSASSHGNQTFCTEIAASRSYLKKEKKKKKRSKTLVLASFCLREGEEEMVSPIYGWVMMALGS